MTERRIKGQEVVARIVRNGVLVPITSFRDMSFTWDLAVLEQGYCGETTVRKDDIFNGISGGLNSDAESADHLLFVDWLKRRAQRLIPPAESRINITARFAFPNGQAPKILVRDAKFDAVGVTFGGRDQYGNTPFNYKAEDARVLAA
jgi:hypothetical protein